MRWGLALFVLILGVAAPAAAQTTTTAQTVPPTTEATTPTTDAPATTEPTIARTTTPTTARTTTRPTTTTSTSTTSTTLPPIEDDDNGENVDIGILGLAGLVGLVGLAAFARRTVAAPPARRVVTEEVTDRTVVLPRDEMDVDATTEVVVYENLSYDELLAQAQAAGIPGFSSMTREELIQALRGRR